jgi:chromosomal replication initiation ATPase DnaA
MQKLDDIFKRRFDRSEEGRDEVKEAERSANIKSATREFGWGYAGTLPDGVPWGAPGFDDFIVHPKGKVLIVALNTELNAAMEWAAGTLPNLVTLAGPPGVGKTHLAGAAAQVVADGHHQLLYRSEHDLLEDFRPGRNPEEAEYAYREVPWLIIDDLGVEALTGWGKAVMDQVVDARWRGAATGLRTLITTNLLSKDLPPRLASRLGDRSRALVVQVAAEDYRRRAQ